MYGTGLESPNLCWVRFKEVGLRVIGVAIMVA